MRQVFFYQIWSKMIKKILINKNGKIFYIKDLDKDFHCEFGFFNSKDLNKSDGTLIKSNKGEEFIVTKPTFFDIYKKIRRDAQIISLKDIGIIICNSGITKNSIVVDAGSGSGALCCYLAALSKKVVSYELRKDFIDIVNENKKSMNLKNLTIKNKDVYETIDERNVDVIILDLPEPWKVIENANLALKSGGFLVSYSPSIPQIIDFVNTILKNKNFCHVKTLELIEREWEVEERVVRPKTRMIGHTGFISFCRKI